LRVLIFHGYLLAGTGSNVYNAALGEALVRAGHVLHLVCQERDPFAFEWVDAAGDWDGGELAVRARREPPRATVYRPNIGGLLPVYVSDRYEGMDARPFPELSADEVDRYIEANVGAVREVVERARPDVAFANHLVMGPLVLARALAGMSVPYAVKNHGSDLEYTIKPHPRFVPYAREGLDGARAVLVGSRHTAESMWTAIGDRDLPARTRLGPPGVDIERFVPREPAEARAGLQELRARLAARDDSSAAAAHDSSAAAHDSSAAAHDSSAAAARDSSAAADDHSFARASGEAAAAIAAIEPDDRMVVFVGKLIASKGAELLLAAWPLVLSREPRARLVMVGFGAFRQALERLARDLDSGALDAVRALRAEDGRELPELAAFLASLQAGEAEAYRLAARGAAERIAWTGRLDHDELADLLPAAEAMAVPSTFPEAFGMVAAEAAACGALPVVANHSGLAEVAQTLGAAVPGTARPWLTFDVGPGAVRELADHLSAWLTAPADLRAATRRAIVATAHDTYSWDGVARGVIAAALGHLDDLPSPPDSMPRR
jgi:glycosyltransferase involved in cell wall biosynthesis